MRASWLALAALLGAHVVTSWFRTHGHPNLFGLAQAFDMNREGNVPTFFSVLLMLTSSLLLAAIASSARRADMPYVRHWRVLALLFLFAALDEAASLHELLDRPLAGMAHVSPFFFFSWVVPGIALVAMFALSYLRFLLHLRPVYQRLFGLAGLIYVAGALGMELLDGRYASTHGQDGWTYALMTGAEEGLEIGGLVLLLHALTKYLRTEIGPLQVAFEPAPPSVRTATDAVSNARRRPSRGERSPVGGRPRTRG